MGGRAWYSWRRRRCANARALAHRADVLRHAGALLLKRPDAANLRALSGPPRASARSCGTAELPCWAGTYMCFYEG